MTNNTTANGDVLVLQCNDNSNFKPHAPGIWPVVCIDIIDLGLVWTEFQGKRKLVRKLKFVFESEVVGEDGKRGILTKNFSASVHPKSNLAGFLGKWRGRPVVPGENIDLKKVIGASATLVVSHQQNMAGKTYASIDAVSKPTKKVTPSGTYDPAAMRQRIAEWAAKDAAGQPPIPQQAAPAPQAATPQPSPGLQPPSPAPASEGNKSAAAPAATDGKPYPEFDPEVGF